MNTSTPTSERVWKKYHPETIWIAGERGRSLHLVTVLKGKNEHFYLPSKLCVYETGYDPYERDIVPEKDSLGTISLTDDFEIRLWNKEDGERHFTPAQLVEMEIITEWSEDEYAAADEARKARSAKKSSSSSRRSHVPEPLEPVANVEIPAELTR